MKVQKIYAEKQRVFVEEYKTKSGQLKNRYKANPNTKVVKIITHDI